MLDTWDNYSVIQPTSSDVASERCVVTSATACCVVVVLRIGALSSPPRRRFYVNSHWALLHTMKRALRTERDVRLAVLFGSTSLGEDQPDSDVDVLIAHRRSEPRSLVGLMSRLRHALDRPVHVVSLEQAQNAPSLLADILQEGHPLIDRDGLWSDLSTQADDILVRAAQEDRDIAASALDTIAQARARLL